MEDPECPVCGSDEIITRRVVDVDAEGDLLTVPDGYPVIARYCADCHEILQRNRELDMDLLGL